VRYMIDNRIMDTSTMELVASTEWDTGLSVTRDVYFNRTDGWYRHEIGRECFVEKISPQDAYNTMAGGGKMTEEIESKYFKGAY
jgi:hypothetical protein